MYAYMLVDDNRGLTPHFTFISKLVSSCYTKSIDSQLIYNFRISCKIINYKFYEMVRWSEIKHIFFEPDI